MSYAEDTDDAEQDSQADEIGREQDADRLFRQLTDGYAAAIGVAIGGLMKCPACRRQVTKIRKEHKFCSGRCKDNYWNTMKLLKAQQ
jgi:hypothetical protein